MAHILVLEAQAIIHGLELLLLLHTSVLEVETDNLELATLLQYQSTSPPWYAADQILLCRSLAKQFSSIRFSHLPRDGNTAAHNLAKVGASLEYDTVFLIPPEQVRCSIYIDISRSLCRDCPHSCRWDPGVAPDWGMHADSFSSRDLVAASLVNFMYNPVNSVAT